MNTIRIFISSVQREFAQERKALRDFLQNDPLMRRFFDVFLFEDVPASDRRPDALYLDEVKQSDLYVGLFGNDYGSEDADGISPTEREFDQATASGIHRLIFVKGTDNSIRKPKMQALIRKAQIGLIRKRFNTSEELVTALYAALVEYLVSKDLIRSEPFDAAPCSKASLRRSRLRANDSIYPNSTWCQGVPTTRRCVNRRFVDPSQSTKRRTTNKRSDAVVWEITAAIFYLFRSPVCTLSRNTGRETDSVLPSLQRHSVSTR